MGKKEQRTGPRVGRAAVEKVVLSLTYWGYKERKKATTQGRERTLGGKGKNFTKSTLSPADYTVSGTVPVLLKSTIYFLTALARFRAEGVVKRWGAHCVLFGWGSISGNRL